MKSLIIPLLIILQLAALAACGGVYTERDFILNTPVSITLYTKTDAEYIDEAFDLCRSYEKLFSRTDPESEIYRLNHGELAEVSQETAALIERGLYYSRLTGGSFDITAGAVTSLWDFTAESPAPPAAEAIAAAVKTVGWENVELDGLRVRLSNGAQLDLGGIAKGYIADRLRDFLVSKGVKNGIINLGGNILCIGTKPGGGDYRVAVQRPFAESGEAVATLGVAGLSVVSSGVYERCFEYGGELYHHILDVKSGYPCHNGLLAVTLVCPESADADALSTACFALGLEAGMTLIDSVEGAAALFIDEDYGLHFSEGFTNICTIIQ